MVSAVYTNVLNHIVQTQSAQTRGFHAALKKLVADRYCPENCDFELEPGNLVHITFDEYIADEMDECFVGASNLRPAAYRIDRDERGWAHVHLYEICLTSPIPKPKLQHYGVWADVREVALFSLHIITAFGNEVVLDNDILECLGYGDPFVKLAEYLSSEHGPPVSATYAGLMIAAAPAKKPRLGAGLSLQQKKNAAFAALKELGFIV